MGGGETVRSGTKELGDWLGTQGYNVDVLHGEMSAAKRKTVMKTFREAKIQILVASDLAARGLDVETPLLLTLIKVLLFHLNILSK